MQAVLSTAVVDRSLIKSTVESYFRRTWSIGVIILEPTDLLGAYLLSCRKKLPVSVWDFTFVFSVTVR